MIMTTCFPRISKGDIGKRNFVLSIAIVALLITLISGCSIMPEYLKFGNNVSRDSTENLPPPMAKRTALTTEQVGRTRVDYYAWLKDPNWQEVMQDPTVLQADIREYLEAENAYTKVALENPTENLQRELFEEMRGRIKEDESSVPTKHGDFAYYSRFRTGGEYPVFARRDANRMFDESAPETILLDGDKEAEGKAYFSVRALEHSPDHGLVAYAFDDQGSEYYTLRVRNIETGEDLGIEIENTDGEFEWTADSLGIYWVKRDENARPSAVYFRALYSDEDVLVYEEPDPGFFVSLSSTRSGDFIFIVTNDHTTTEVRFVRSDSVNPFDFTLVEKRQKGVEYSLTHHDDRFFIRTNIGGALDFKLMQAPIESPSRDNWRDVVPYKPGTLLLGVGAVKNFLIRMERENGLPKIVVRDRRDGEEHLIEFKEKAYDLDLYGGFEYDTDEMRFGYASPTTPDQVFDYNLETKTKILRKTREIPSGHNREDYLSDRILVPALDGEEIPVTILRHKDTSIDGNSPLLLYGYGSYGVTYPADFRSSRLSLVDRGFIYAIAHVRGSQSKGYQWYLDGKLDKKVNTFKDYISVAKYLTQNGYSKPKKIVGFGGSAGGLLMGAVANMNPELFAGIIAAVPFVDVINTMSDTSLPLTPPEWPEWGNPLESAEDYDQILEYSPYDNISNKRYPAMLVTGGLSDPRVTYWEPAKYVARLRHDSPNGGPYYLRINMEAGHGGASGRFEGLKETALEYAFALRTVGLATESDKTD